MKSTYFLWEFGSQMSRLDPWKVIDSQDEWRMSAKRQNLTDYQTKIFGTSLGEKVTKWKDNARRQNLTRIVLQKIWNQFQRKKSQNGDECRKKQMFSHWSSFSHWSLSAFYINQGRKGRSQNFESMTFGNNFY